MKLIRILDRAFVQRLSDDYVQCAVDIVKTFEMPPYPTDISLVRWLQNILIQNDKVGFSIMNIMSPQNHKCKLRKPAPAVLPCMAGML